MNQQMTDKEYLTDAVSSQKLTTGNYNTFASECVCTQLKDEFINLLREEHDIQHELFKEMQSRGWYSPEQADQNKVTQTRNKFSNAL